MTTNLVKEIVANIIDGPNEMGMSFSFLRTSKAPYGIDMTKGTSIHFTTDGKNGAPAGFSAALNGWEREDGSGHSWLIKGYLLENDSYYTFSGYYNSRTRKGKLTLSPKKV